MLYLCGMKSNEHIMKDDTTKVVGKLLGITCLFISPVVAIGTIGMQTPAQAILLIVSAFMAIYGITRFFNDK